MGTIRKGLLIGQAGFQRPIVIKQLQTPEPEHLRLFVEEARRYAVLDHENIGRIFDFERVGGELCIILEYIDGWSLVEYLERHRELGACPTWTCRCSSRAASAAPCSTCSRRRASSTATSARAT